MESDNAVIALSWRRSSEARNPSKRTQKKNLFLWPFACILVVGWEGQVHILNFIYSALRVDWLMYRAPSPKKIPFRFFLKAKFATFRRTAATGLFPVLFRD
jgi:hypothetical protein